jgi:hypothetical protein
MATAHFGEGLNSLVQISRSVARLSGGTVATTKNRVFKVRKAKLHGVQVQNIGNTIGSKHR